MTSTAVRVALRVRPLTQKEKINSCTQCLTFIPNEPQILIGTDKSFTYDYVFDTSADQATIYSSAASPLLHKFIDGFNATILAYGQTGSGKTFSMGTSLDSNVHAENKGIVPRCVVELFQILQSRKAQDDRYKYEIHTSFVELYNEDFVDLLNVNSAPYPPEVIIREDIAGNIYLSGVKEQICFNFDEILGCLKQGSLNRATGATEMNSVSSRSHAIFSIILKQQKPEEEDGKTVIRSLLSKFHFVDLAGSERLKRTNAQGDRFKEGIAINSGLLALGNVISALGDEARRATHIPYRDSKLTRFLQDSLGGNSQTLMLACVSPADVNFLETLNTLKYANRARNIKNRVVVNQDFAGSSVEVNQLKALVSRLRLEIRTSEDIKNENKRLLKEANDQLAQVTSERDTLLMGRELDEFMKSESSDNNILETIDDQKKVEVHPIIAKYQKTIQELNLELSNTKDQLESMKKSAHSSNNLLQKFSVVPSRNNSGIIKKRFSPTTAAKSTVKRRPRITKSTSTSLRKSTRQASRKRVSAKDESGNNPIIQEDMVRHEEVKENIAKIRADIRKSLQILQLVSPTNEKGASWEDELKEQYKNEMQRTHSDESLFSLKSLMAEGVIINKAVPAWDDRKHSTSETISKPKSNKHNPQLYRMLQQIQSDIKMKEELVSYLEKSETEFTFMRQKFDERISYLHTQLVQTQKNKDIELTRVRSAKPATSVAKKSAEIRHTYETKMKNLMSEIQELKRKYASATKAMQSTRSQNETLLRTLKVNVETLKGEKKRLTQRMKIESDRVREQMSKQEKKIQQLQRQQAKVNQAKRKLERENEQHKNILKKKAEEVMMNSNQVKQLVSIVKKAVREGGVLDERILSKLVPIVGGHFAVIARGGGHGYPKRNAKRKNPLPLDIRVARKKELLDKALYQYIQGKQAVVEMEQLLIRRERLVEEKIELEEERGQVYHMEKEHQEHTGQPMDTMAIEFMDERMDLISAEISYLSTRIHTLQAVAAHEMAHEESTTKHAKHVTFVDEIVTESPTNDEWADIDSFEEQYKVPVNASPEIAYEITCKILKSFENDERRCIIENLIDDVMDLKMNEVNQQITVQNLETTVIDLRRKLLANSDISKSESEQPDNNILDMIMQNSGDCSPTDSSHGLVSSSLYQYGQHQIALPDSPAVSPPFKNNPFSSLTDQANLVDPIVTRRSTPSPDRFFNMMQDRLPWQPTSNEDTESPPDFDHYVSDHESSTSTIRSSHYKRQSVDSNEPVVSTFLARLNARKFENTTNDEQTSPLYSHSCQSPRVKKPVLTLVPSASTFERPTTPSVFDRLAQTPTRSSRAKINSVP